MHPSLVKSAKSALPLYAVTAQAWAGAVPGLSARDRGFAAAAGFSGKAGSIQGLCGPDGSLSGALLGLGKGEDHLALAVASEKLPEGRYELATALADPALAALGWVLGTYAFSRYKTCAERKARLVLPGGVDGAEVSRIAEAVFWGRDLVATPASDMGPEELAAAAKTLAKRHDAKISVIAGAALLEQNFPMIHAVGRASSRAPRLIDLTWGKSSAPKLTLAGKGVCFDSGGLDLKNPAGMLTMKKDMGGAASVLALAQMIMDAGLPVRLRVLIPAVENSISGDAYRPGDVLTSRKGLTVEIGNTDAEGRLVLADALTLADAERPDLLIDIATLTGAARAATGMELPPFFSTDEGLAAELSRCGALVQDPLWRLPLWAGYDGTLDSPIADLTNAPHYSLAGAITAALFLNRFVSQSPRWLHLDIPAWNDRARPGRPVGPEVNTVRALFALICARYPKPVKAR